MVGVGVIALALSIGAWAASAAPLPGAPSCPVFPSDNPWNARVDTLPVVANSTTIISTIGVDTGLHPDFGSGLWDGYPIGIPITVVPGTQAKSKVSFDYADESDPGPYPIPKNVLIEGGSDRSTRSSSTRAPASSTSSSRSRRAARRGRPARARSGV